MGCGRPDTVQHSVITLAPRKRSKNRRSMPICGWFAFRMATVLLCHSVSSLENLASNAAAICGASRREGLAAGGGTIAEMEVETGESLRQGESNSSSAE